MEFVLRTHNVDVTPTTKELIQRRLGFALDRFQKRIKEVRVYLMDENGPRKGIDTVCQLTIFLRGLGKVTVLKKDSAIPAAVAKAARIATRRISKGLKRKLSRSAGSVCVTRTL
jgi:ribosome-associated translation inhibitor RaiA